MPTLARVVVLISGSGTNLQAIIDACASGELAAQVCAAVSNVRDAYGLERARQAGIPAVVCTKRKEQSREDYDAALAQVVGAYKPDWIVLAGWMRILSSVFLNAFPNRIINLHPALPGMFPGTDSIARALEAYQQGKVHETGVMVHLVPDERVDSGPVLNLEHVPIMADDTVESLHNRIRPVEHRLLITTLRELVQSAR